VPLTPHSTSVLVIEFQGRLDPDTYSAVVYGCWAVLVAGGHARQAMIRPDDSVTGEQLADVLEDLIANCRWGW
jgi:hypothetical protein